MFDRGPSIQNASVLHKKNGSFPMAGRARLIPPPWSRSVSRSSDMTILGGLPPGEMRLDLVGVPVDVDDRPLDAVLGQPIEAMIDERPAADLDQGLRQRIGDRPHARSQTRGEHHGGLGRGRGHRRSLRGSCGADPSNGWPSARGRWF